MWRFAEYGRIQQGVEEGSYFIYTFILHKFMEKFIVKWNDHTSICNKYYLNIWTIPTSTDILNHKILECNNVL